MREPPPSNFYWVRPQLLAAGEYPKAATLVALIGAGVGGFIDLSTEIWLRGYARRAARLAGAAGRDALHRSFPIRDRSVPTVDTMRAILDAVDAWLAAARPVYVHCYAGIGRTGTVVGCWLVRHGAAPAAALAELTELRHGTRHATLASPETPEQHEFVAAWARGG
jgi:hypothetical protein